MVHTLTDRFKSNLACNYLRGRAKKKEMHGFVGKLFLPKTMLSFMLIRTN
jgi:hypothetical protein